MNRLTQYAAIAIAIVFAVECQAETPVGSSEIALMSHQTPSTYNRCQSGGCFCDFDFMFMKLSSADGIKDASQNEAPFDRKFVPRITLGYQIPERFGFRVRYWEHDSSTTSIANQLVSSDTYVIDAEVFQTFFVTYRTSIEVSGGVRHAGFSYDRGADDQYSLNNAFGLVAGVQVNQATRMGTFYARARGGMVNGDAQIESSFNQEVIRSQHELGVGLENSIYVAGFNISGRIGYEIMSLNNYVGTNDDDDQVADLGLHGFVVGLGVAR